MSKVCQLFSGSSGNSILISSKGHNFLVDIGVSAKKCENSLLNIGIDPDSIDAVFVTHEHTDHSNGVRIFAQRHKTPVFAAEKCIENMMYTGMLNDKVVINTVDNCMELCGVEIVTFRQSHDSVDCLGYRFNLQNSRSISVCTDTGYITENARDVLPGTDLIFIESNHETSMVETGPYPYHLKQRILSGSGHLSNFACGEYIKELAQSGTTRFILSHLSRENNTPHIARQSAVCALSEIGLSENTDFRLFVSEPENSGGGISI